jgi:thymidine phosphorylase
MELLINAGANVNAIGSDGVRSVIYKYERALAYEKEAIPVQAKEYLKDYREKCCLVLGELMIHGAMPKNDEEKENILKIFEEREGFDKFKEVVKLKLEVNSVSNVVPPQKPPRTFEMSKRALAMMFCFRKSPFTLRCMTLRLVTH